MNREIKFRGWLPTVKKMFYPNIIPNPTTSEYMYGDENTGYYMLGVGIKDINSKDVYEGDIIKVSGIIGKILWVQEHCSFMLLGVNPVKYYRLRQSETQRVEVIGNIYQNRDILEGK